MPVFRLGDSYAGVASAHNPNHYFSWLKSLRSTLLKELDAVSLDIDPEPLPPEEAY